MDKICATCHNQAWHEGEWKHSCTVSGESIQLEDTCDGGWRESRRGQYEHVEFSKDKMTEDEYHEIIDMTNEENDFTWEVNE